MKGTTSVFIVVAFLVPFFFSSCATMPVQGPPVLDSDKDGVPDNYDNRALYKAIPPYQDYCLATPAGVKVDANGCPFDTDKDGVPDYLDKCPGTPAGVKVDDLGCPLDSDGDGVPDFRDKCPGTPAGVKVDDLGCPLDSDGDAVPDFRDKCPGTPAGVKVDADGCSPKARIILLPEPDGTVGRIDISTTAGSQILDRPWTESEVVSPALAPGEPKAVDEKEIRTSFGAVLAAEPAPVEVFTVYFGFGSAKLTDQSSALIPEISNAIEAQRSNDIRVIGYTDTVGSKEYNRGLSEKRAAAVADLLVSKGVGRATIKTEYFGEERLLVETPDNTDEPKNRRVEIIVR